MFDLEAEFEKLKSELLITIKTKQEAGEYTAHQAGDLEELVHDRMRDYGGRWDSSGCSF